MILFVVYYLQDGIVGFIHPVCPQGGKVLRCRSHRRD
jgi:hypothetical protein